MYNFKTELARKSWLSGLPLPSTLFPSSCRLGLNGAHPFHLFLRLPWRTLGFLIVSLVFSPQKWNKIQGAKSGVFACSSARAVAGWQQLQGSSWALLSLVITHFLGVGLLLRLFATVQLAKSLTVG